MTENLEDSLAKLSGAAVIKKYLITMPSSAGVYRMIDKAGKILYIGKAKNLAKRLINYTQTDRLSQRIKTMVLQVDTMEIITTNSEAEALLLEASMIKTLQPRYNILLRDDKSFPYILIEENHQFNRLTKHRGNKSLKGKYFGPFASVRDVNNTISLLQKIFQIRTCTDAFFEARKRPCMLYQIKRCSAPCTNKIDLPDYQDLIKQTLDFLNGKTVSLQANLSKLMENASLNTEYELAATYRDRIKALTAIQARQTFTNLNAQDCDVIALHHELGSYCVQIFFYRGGKSYGNKAYFPAHAEEANISEVLSAFIGQFYQNNYPPKEVIISHDIDHKAAICDALSLIVKYKVKIIIPKAGNKSKLINLAIENAKAALKSRVNAFEKQQKILSSVKELFKLNVIPARIEVYDNSHIMGQHAVGAMICAKNYGFDKNAYRRFNMNKIAPKILKGGDDYAMMKEMLTRRLSRLKQESPEYESEVWPDLMLIDGGLGHLSTAHQVLKELDLNIPLVCISKGPDRNAGREIFHKIDMESFTLPFDEPVMRYLQILRDESHRFAIGSHRIKRDKTLKTSMLDFITSIGSKRKKSLLNHFGSVQAIKEASIEDLIKVEHINKNTAQMVYNYLHNKK